MYVDILFLLLDFQFFKPAYWHSLVYGSNMKDYTTSPPFCQEVFAKIPDYFNLAMEMLRFSSFFGLFDVVFGCGDSFSRRFSCLSWLFSTSRKTKISLDTNRNI